MRFTPKSQAQLDEDNMLPPGIYDFEVQSAEEATSKAGNEMIKITLKVFRPDGGHMLITDYLMEKLAFKLRHFHETTGRMDCYEAGGITAYECQGLTGRVKLKQKAAEGEFRAKNEVADYEKPEKATVDSPKDVAPRAESTRRPAPAPAYEDPNGVPF